MKHQTVAIAVVRDNPPSILVAEDLDVLHRALAVRLVAKADPNRIPAAKRDALRTALLNDRWSDAVALWIEQHGVAIDVYTEDVLTSADLPRDLLGAQMQLSPLFTDP
jgi:hypothetical protein